MSAPRVELSPSAIRAEMERADAELLRLADIARETFGASLKYLETDRVKIGRPADSPRKGESEPVVVVL